MVTPQKAARGVILTILGRHLRQFWGVMVTP